MSKTTNTTREDIQASVSSIYSQLLTKRKEEKEAKEEQKRQEQELQEQEKEAKKLNADGTKKSKKERREAEFDNWKEIIIGLTGDDLEYSDVKKEKKKKKYKKWIDDNNESSALIPKQKKNKKKNYNKEFAPELQMLKTIVADQNKFTADLQKRFNTMAGPATKDAMPPNKTMVELASVINAGRSNSLGVLKEIGNLKKVVAELYMKQRKEDAANGGMSVGPTDLALMGSSVASSLFADEHLMPMIPSVSPSNSYSSQPNTSNTSTIQPTMNVDSNNISNGNDAPVQQMVQPMIPQYQEFDPNSWDGPDDIKLNPSVEFENIPHSIVVEMDSSGTQRRFKAIRDDNGEELHGCPVPTYDPKVLIINEKDKIAKGQFDETYKVDII